MEKNFPVNTMFNYKNCFIDVFFFTYTINYNSFCCWCHCKIFIVCFSIFISCGVCLCRVSVLYACVVCLCCMITQFWLLNHDDCHRNLSYLFALLTKFCQNDGIIYSCHTKEDLTSYKTSFNRAFSSEKAIKTRDMTVV